MPKPTIVQKVSGARRVVITVASVIAVFIVCFASYRRAAAARVLQSTREQNEFLASVLERLKGRRSTPPPQSARSVELSSETRDEPGDQRREITHWDPIAEAKAFEDRHPEVREAIRSYARVGVLSRYGSLFKRLNLPEDQLNELVDLLSDGTSFNVPVGGKPMFFQADRGTLSSDDRQQRIHQLMGADGYRQYQEYDRTLPARTVVEQLAADLATSDPLTSEQSDALVQALGAAVAPRRGRTAGKLDWNIVPANASPPLSPTQLEALATIKAREEYQAAATNAIVGHSR